MGLCCVVDGTGLFWADKAGYLMPKTNTFLCWNLIYLKEDSNESKSTEEGL